MGSGCGRGTGEAAEVATYKKKGGRKGGSERVFHWTGRTAVTGIIRQVEEKKVDAKYGKNLRKKKSKKRLTSYGRNQDNLGVTPGFNGS